MTEERPGPVTYQLPAPAGFGNCGQCAYFASGPPSVCQQCAAATLQPAAPFSCPVCGQRIATAQGTCSNRLCSDPQRSFEFNHAIAMKTGPLDRAIKAHKYEHRWGWGHHLRPRPARPPRPRPGHRTRRSDHPHAGRTPAARHDTRKEIDHSGWVIESAAAQDTVGYPLRVDPPVIVKTRPTARMASTSNYGERLAVADDIYDASRVLNPAAVAGATVVVVDDVFTTGITLNAVARRLREAGARTVRGLTLARQPWG